MLLARARKRPGDRDRWFRVCALSAGALKCVRARSRVRVSRCLPVHVGAVAAWWDRRRRIHKQHHRFRFTHVLASEFAHPLEDANNIVCTILGPLLLGSHMSLVFLYGAIKLAQARDDFVLISNVPIYCEYPPGCSCLVGPPIWLLAMDHHSSSSVLLLILLLVLLLV